MLAPTTLAYCRALAATSWCGRANIIGAVTLLTIAAVTGSRYSSGWGGGVALHASRQSETSVTTRLRISEVDAVADAHEQPRGVADLQPCGTLAQLGPCLDLQNATMALIVEVSVRRVDNRCVPGICGRALKQHAGTDTPGSKQRVTRDELPAD